MKKQTHFTLNLIHGRFWTKCAIKVIDVYLLDCFWSLRNL